MNAHEQVAQPGFGKGAGDQERLLLRSVHDPFDTRCRFVQRIGVKALIVSRGPGAGFLQVVELLQKRQRGADHARRHVVDNFRAARPDRGAGSRVCQIGECILARHVLIEMRPGVVCQVDVIQRVPEKDRLDLLNVVNDFGNRPPDMPVRHDIRRER